MRPTRNTHKERGTVKEILPPAYSVLRGGGKEPKMHVDQERLGGRKNTERTPSSNHIQLTYSGLCTPSAGKGPRLKTKAKAFKAGKDSQGSDAVGKVLANQAERARVAPSGGLRKGGAVEGQGNRGGKGGLIYSPERVKGQEMCIRH